MPQSSRNLVSICIVKRGIGQVNSADAEVERLVLDRFNGIDERQVLADASNLSVSLIGTTVNSTLYLLTFPPSFFKESSARTLCFI